MGQGLLGVLQPQWLAGHGKAIDADEAMLAVGRKPMTQDLGLDLAGVEQDWSGHISVDEFSKTNVDNIWAVGDVSNRVPLTPVANHESMCFIETEYPWDDRTAMQAALAEFLSVDGPKMPYLPTQDQ